LTLAKALEVRQSKPTVTLPDNHSTFNAGYRANQAPNTIKPVISRTKRAAQSTDKLDEESSAKRRKVVFSRETDTKPKQQASKQPSSYNHYTRSLNNS